MGLEEEVSSKSGLRICPACDGTGRVVDSSEDEEDEICSLCDGTGKIN
jgi:DnaJ-class molecular chaperone